MISSRCSNRTFLPKCFSTSMREAIAMGIQRKQQRAVQNPTTRAYQRAKIILRRIGGKSQLADDTLRWLFACCWKSNQLPRLVVETPLLITRAEHCETDPRVGTATPAAPVPRQENLARLRRMQQRSVRDKRRRSEGRDR